MLTEAKAKPTAPRLLTHFLTPLLSRSATHIVTGIGILLLDYWTGPSLNFPILFVIPVVMSAWFCSARLSYALALLLPLCQFMIAIFTDPTASIATTAANALIRAAVLVLLAFLVALTARQSREIKVLRGWLPICMWCKRIRTEDGSWEKFEAYIAAHSEADFTHSLCPECKEEHYGDLFDKK